MSVLPFLQCPDTATPISVSDLPMFGVITVADGDGKVGADVTFAAVAQYFSRKSTRMYNRKKDDSPTLID